MAKGDKDQENADAEESSGGSKLKFVWMGLAGIVLIAGSVFATLMFVGGDDSAGDAAAEQVEEAPKAIYYAINPEFRSSYQVNGRQRLFQVALTLVTRESDVVDAFAKHAPAIRNKVVILLSGSSFESLQTLDGRESLREALLAGIQEILQAEIDKPGIESVLFTQFVMQ